MKQDPNTGRFVQIERDLTGQKINLLTPLKRIRKLFNNDKSFRWGWECICDCGNKVLVIETRLIHNKIKSCGCYQGKNHGKPFGESSAHLHFVRYKNSAEDRKLTFELSREEFDLIVKNNCYYCEALPINKSFCSGNNGHTIANGIDRVNNKLGYIKDNCVACCFSCNKAKSSLTQQEFFNLITKIYGLHCKENNGNK